MWRNCMKHKRAFTFCVCWIAEKKTWEFTRHSVVIRVYPGDAPAYISKILISFE